MEKVPKYQSAAREGLYLEIFNFWSWASKACREKMRELVSDQWAISRRVGSDTGLTTKTILKVHTRQNYCLNKS